MAIASTTIVGSRVFLADFIGDTIRLHITISNGIKIVTQAKVRVRECEFTGDEELLFYLRVDAETYTSMRLPVDQTADYFRGMYFIEIV